jgi:hypothetical protein
VKITEQQYQQIDSKGALADRKAAGNKNFRARAKISLPPNLL